MLHLNFRGWTLPFEVVMNVRTRAHIGAKLRIIIMKVLR